MKQFILKRWWLHFLVGLCLGYIAGFNAQFLDYLNGKNSQIENIIAVCLGVFSVAFFIWVIAAIFEVIQASYVKFKTKSDVDTFDWLDVHFSVFGGVAGGVLALLIHSNQLHIGLIVLCAGLFLYEIVRMIESK